METNLMSQYTAAGLKQLGADLPNPSLCDSCVFAYNIKFGSTSYGGKCYIQRYCEPLKIAIHGDGKQNCVFHTTSEKAAEQLKKNEETAKGGK